ncbi:aspartate kinase [Candidatus Pelagibacter sp. HIMB1517]|uniref:aspartate kinase n=1 Tax=Candidatus Pelagibacter sp. HIMB1517 TaxID=3413341 RepID=UPI003F83F3AD
MTTIVMKFGGTSVANIDRIKNVADIIVNKKKEGFKIAVIVSAMAGVTNDLVDKSKAISSNFSNEEYDVLLSSGEQVTSALLSACLIDKGIKARSMLGWQIPIVTEGQHKNSRIVSVNSKPILENLNNDHVVVVPGFQGVSEKLRISTIGRGGSDASAVALAKALDAERCEIYTDVEGVFTTNPDICDQAKKIEKISYDEMLEMATLGAKVMQSSSVQKAMMNDVEIYVKSTFAPEKDGTQILAEDKISYDKVITGVAYTRDDAKVTLVGVKDKPGVASAIFKPLNDQNIVVDMIVQNISAETQKTDVTFTIKRDDLKKTETILGGLKSDIGYDKLSTDNKVSKISIVGAGMITYPGVAFKMFNALASKNINILVISTSEIKISVLIDDKNTELAVKTLHSAFELD